MKTRTRVPSSVTVQAKPRMTQPGDAAEREADRLADAALEPAGAVPLTATEPAAPVMRQVDDDERRDQPEYEEEDGYDLALKARSAVTPAAPSGFVEALRSSAGGRPLEAGVRTRMERGFGQSFDGVRVHSDASSSRLSDRIDARAFTHGRDIYFGAGEYAPGTESGDRLLAHELAHTLQQAPPGRIARAEQRKSNEDIRREAHAQAASWRAEFDSLTEPRAIDRGPWTAIIKSSLQSAQRIRDPAQKAIRTGYLEGQLALFEDDYYAWLVSSGKIFFHGGGEGLRQVGDPSATLEPYLLALLDRSRTRMRAGADAYVIFTFQQSALQAREAEDPQPEAPAIGAFDAATSEDKELLEEFHSALADVPAGELEYDEERLLAELRLLSPEDRKDFYEFARSLATPSPGAEDRAKRIAPDEAIEVFARLDPASREALRVNREARETESVETEAMPESVRLELKGKVAEQKAGADAAQQLASNLDRIRAKALPPELAKELEGIDLGFSLFHDEVSFLLGLLAGAGEQSPQVKTAGDELLKSIVEFTRELQTEMAWLIGESALIAGITAFTQGAAAGRLIALAVRIRSLIAKVEKLRAAYAIKDRVTRVIGVIKTVREAYPQFQEWYAKTSAEYAQLQRRLESIDPDESVEDLLGAKEDELLERLDELLEDQGGLGQILEMLYIPEDTPPDELRQILFDIPRGITALDEGWQYYNDKAQQGKPHFAEVLSVRGYRAGRYLYPFVGFASAMISEQLRAAFPERSFEDKVNRLIAKATAQPKHRERNRDLFGRLNRKRYTIVKSDLEDLKTQARNELDRLIDVHEPGSRASEHWTPFWFKRAIRRELKTLNRTFQKKTVRATRPPAKPGGPTPAPERVPAPPIRVKLDRAGPTDTEVVAHVKVNPDGDIKRDRLTLTDFDGAGYEYAGDADRKAAIGRFLRDGEYDLTLHPDGGDYIRIRGGEVGEPKRPWLKFDGTRIKKMDPLDKDGYKPFIRDDWVVGDEHDLPEGYHFERRAGDRVNIARKRGLAALGYQQLGLGPKRQLVLGTGDAVAETVAPLQLKPHTMEPYDHAAGVAAMYAPPLAGVSPPKKAQRADAAAWTAHIATQADLQQRPKAIEGRLGYTIRARALGSSLDRRHLPGLREEDDKGHIVARRFGSDTDDPYWNLVPMLRRVNQFPGEWYRLEATMAEYYVGKTATPGDYVDFAVTIAYPDKKTRRPSKFIAKYNAFDAKGSPKPGGSKTKNVDNE